MRVSPQNRCSPRLRLLMQLAAFLLLQLEPGLLPGAAAVRSGHDKQDEATAKARS